LPYNLGPSKATILTCSIERRCQSTCQQISYTQFGRPCRTRTVVVWQWTN